MQADKDHNDHKTRVILIAEGHKALQDSLKDLVVTELPDAQVLTVSSGKEALRLCLAHRPSAVILDVDLRELNGIEVTREINHNKPDTPIVLIHEEGFLEYRISVLAEDARGYVAKNRISVDLVPVLKKLLLTEGRKKQKEGNS